MNTTTDVGQDIFSHKYIPLPAGKTFWDEGQFETVAKRIENGKKTIKDFIEMVEERAVIERRYADRLQNWYNKWSLNVKHGSEYGDIQTVWQSVLNEGSSIASVHFKISEKLGLSHTKGIQKGVTAFKEQHYHRLPLQKELKESKDCKDAFKAIQAPYKKAVENILKYKKKYLEASKSCLHLGSKDGVATAKLDSLAESKEKAKSKYMDVLHQFDENVRETYVKEMSKEFQKHQDVELDRLRVLLNSLHDYIGIVDLQAHLSSPLSNLYREATAPLNTAKPEKMILLFSKRFGAEMQPNFPKFEDADEEPLKTQLQTSSFLPRLALNLIDLRTPNTILLRLKHLRADLPLQSSYRKSSTKDFLLRRPSHTDNLTGDRNNEFQNVPPMAAKLSFDSAILQADSLNTLSEEDLTFQKTSKDHYHLSNVYVRVIANFNSTNREHLQANKGEVIYQIRGDDKGWCYGRIAHKEGIYPSKAVKLLTLNVLA
ncbi:protein kinase C and casein kinase substrate in neurons protein 2-like [Watersipora subatra]|uniref:protein kinase C and casein kinase substrate in neurons protein 2-like n=1 Tax=Watersipora subatra TaxID=2589382 RepID=UPI00355B2D99